MRLVLVVVAGGVFVAVAVLWNLAVVCALHLFKISLPFSFPFRFTTRKQPELLQALSGRSIDTYVGISGLLLFAGPLFAGLTAYNYVIRHFIFHSTYGLNSFVESVASLAILGVAGVWFSIRNWKKSTEAGIGYSMLAILVLKISTDTMGVLTVAVLLIPAALGCAFVYFGIRRIRDAFAGTGTRYSNRRDMGVQNVFVGEPFVPSEQHKAQQTAIAQKLIAPGMNPEQSSGNKLRNGDPGEL